MKLPSSRSSNCKIEIITDDEPIAPKSCKYDATSFFVLFFTIFLATGSMTYILYQAQQHHTEAQLKSDEFKKLVQSIFIETNELIKHGGVMVEFQVLDKNHNLLWFKPIDEESLIDEDRVEKEIVEEFEEVEDEISRRPLIIRHVRDTVSTNTLSYIVSHQTQYVNCDRFKPIPRGKYLVPPSLYALHKCYEYGVTMEELDRGILRREQGGEFRYNLPDIYIACDDVFNSQMDELTNELKVDYERCKFSGALDESQQKIVEERFAPEFEASNAPANIEMSPPSNIEINSPSNMEMSSPSNMEMSSPSNIEMSSPSNIDVSSPQYEPTTLPPPSTSTRRDTFISWRNYVDCNHLKLEYFEDTAESPSLEALELCRKYGITYDELRQGHLQNPHLDKPRSDVSNLMVHCTLVFWHSKLEYLTNELKQDYRQCKQEKAISKKVQEKIENQFYEALYDERDVTTKRPAERSTTSSTTTTTTTEIMTTSNEVDFEQQTTPAIVPPAAFANNCKRVENKDFYICIKVITSYNSPVIKV